jgi:hypothetical protein
MALLAAVAEALAAHQQAEARAAQMVPSTLSQEVATIDWWVWANTVIIFITACLSFRTTGACALLIAYRHNLAAGRHQLGGRLPQLSTRLLLHSSLPGCW